MLPKVTRYRVHTSGVTSAQLSVITSARSSASVGKIIDKPLTCIDDVGKQRRHDQITSDMSRRQKASAGGFLTPAGADDDDADADNDNRK
jgi:hypothetical protein